MKEKKKKKNFNFKRVLYEYTTFVDIFWRSFKKQEDVMAADIPESHVIYVHIKC